MENEIKDKDSDMSLNSSSNSSKSSKQARVDDDTLKMGTEPIEELVPPGYAIHFISLILPQLTKCAEYIIVTKFVGLEALSYLIFL